jgi:peptide/nickel transport system substrate-binding protein
MKQSTVQRLAMRRRVLKLLGAGSAAAAGGWPALQATAQARNATLVIGLDISDAGAVTPDPARMNFYTPPLTTRTVYETLITLAPGDYQTLRPLLAESWERTPDGKGFRFRLRKNVKFVSGAPMTADDVKFSFDRLVNVKDQPSAYADNLGRVEVVDPYTVDVFPTNMDLPLLTILTAPSCGIYEKKIALANGATADADAKNTDKAAQWFGTTSIGTGPYKLVTWERNVQVTMVRNPHYWNGTPGFERVIIRHIGDGGAQLLALKRGDIDVAFNLSPSSSLRSATPRTSRSRRSRRSTTSTWRSPALPSSIRSWPGRKPRQAIAYAIDYDGIRDALFGGVGVRPASFIPYGIGGSSKPFVEQARYGLNPAKAKEMLAKAGVPDGFEFEMAYGTAAIAGASFPVIAQKMQSDLAKVGIKAQLRPMDYANLRTVYYQGRRARWSCRGTSTPWSLAVGSAALDRVAKARPLERAADHAHRVVGGGRRARQRQAGGAVHRISSAC